MMVNTFHFDQVETYPWVSKQQIKQLGKEASTLYTLANPLNPEFPFLRDEMAYNLLTICAKNSKFFDQFRIFDLGKVWKPGENIHSHHLDPRYAEEHFCEELHLGACWYEKSLTNRSEDPLLKAKTIIEKLISKLGIKGRLSFEKSDMAHFHPKKQAKLILRNGPTPLEIGMIATVHPLLMKTMKFPETAQLCLFDLNLELLKKLVHQANNEKAYETLQDQIVRRDLSFVVNANESFEKVITTLEKMKEIDAVKVFDLYQGANLGENKKSVSVQIKIKGDGSMTTDAINTIMQSAIKKVEATGAMLRA